MICARTHREFVLHSGCGNPSCDFRDSARRHRLHLNLKFYTEGNTYLVYIPAEQVEPIKSTHAAWLPFQEIGFDISADSHEQFPRDLKREKQAAKADKTRARRKASWAAPYRLERMLGRRTSAKQKARRAAGLYWMRGAN